MKYFIDTEFIEDGKTIDLISIGIVSEDDREYYAINGHCDFSKANDWVLENVLKPMGLDRDGFSKEISDPLTLANVKTRECIASEIMKFVGYDTESQGLIGWDALNEKSLPDCSVEFWGYYADYDWVVFCQLFGRMIDLPKGFPMYCRDIKQFCDDLGNPSLPTQDKGEHNALEDARWNKLAYESLISILD